MLIVGSNTTQIEKNVNSASFDSVHEINKIYYICNEQNIKNMICTKCKIEKDNSLFRVRLKTKFGLHYWCRDCENIANKKRYIPKPKHIKNPKEAYLIKLDSLKRMLKYRYSITYEQYIAMYNEQNNSCKICKMSNILGGKRGLQVDHCHKTNKIRGLICPACNRGMIFIDKINDISIIINYKK